MALGKRLKKARENARKTQKQIADTLGISIGTLSGYERDYRDPDTDTLNRLAELYAVSTDYLLGRTENMHVTEDSVDDDLKKLTEDPDFMVAYKEYPGSPEEAKEDLIGFLKLIKERDERKKKK